MARGKRRANGEGTIYQRVDGRYEGKLWALTTAGTLKRVSVYGRTWEECHGQFVDLQARTLKGVPVASVEQKLDQYLEYWLEQVARPSVRPLTYRTYAMYVRRHLKPALGSKKLSKLTARDVRTFVNVKRGDISRSPRQAKQGSALSPRTVFHLHAVLRNALDHAVREDLITRNVAKQVRVTAGERVEPEPWSVDEARAFLKAVRDDRWYALYAVALSLGLRRGEALGLRWADVDFDANVLRIRQTLQRQGGVLRTATPKTRRSMRTLPLLGGLADVLREHWERQQREAADGGWDVTGFVFTTRRGTPIQPDELSRQFAATCERAGVRRIRLHELRHTCASLLLAQGVPPRVVMEILGHSGLDMTMNVYGHVMLDSQRDALRGLDNLLGE